MNPLALPPILFGVGPEIFVTPMGAVFAAEAISPEGGGQELDDLIQGTSGSQWREALCRDATSWISRGGIFATPPLAEKQKSLILDQLVDHQRRHRKKTAASTSTT